MATALGLVLLASAMVAACGGGGKTDSTGRNAPTYAVGGTIAGLDEGFLVLSNGLDVQTFSANPDGLASDRAFQLDTPLPAGSGYDVRIVNDPLSEFALQCDVIDGSGQMPSGPVGNVLVRCARVKSVRLLAGQIASAAPARDGLQFDARFRSPKGAAVDDAGNIFIADDVGHTIRRITPKGVVSTFAGSDGQSGSADGQGADARFNRPRGLAMDRQGNLFVADTGNSTIRRISPQGLVTTLAGLALNPGLAPGVGRTAQFNAPVGVAVASTGIVYVADTGNSAIRAISTTGEVSTLAVNTLTNTWFNAPVALAASPAGDQVYVADSGNHTIVRISSAGVVSPFVGVANAAESNDAAPARFNSPSGLAVDAAGVIYVADSKNSTIRRVTPAGEVSTLAGRPLTAGVSDGLQGDALFNEPAGLSVDKGGSLVVADSLNRMIRRVQPSGLVTTVAGSAIDAGITDGHGAEARFNQPNGIAADRDGNVYVADTNNHTIRRITPEGMVSTFAGTAGRPGHVDAPVAQFSFPEGVAVDAAGNVYVADTGNALIRRITPGGVVSTWAGVAVQPGTVLDDPPRFRSPSAIAIGPDGTAYVADTGNNAVRKITPARVVSTMAGAGTFRAPKGIAVDALGRVLVADTVNFSIRVVSDAAVSTLAGSAADRNYLDTPEGATSRFMLPEGLAVDAAGDLYVADSGASAIRTVQGGEETRNAVQTLAGGSLTPAGPVRLGALPQPVGQPSQVAVTRKRIYFTSENAVMFIDR